MTVAELIAKLQDAPQDLAVYCHSAKYRDTQPVADIGIGPYRLDHELNSTQFPQFPTADRPANAFIISWQIHDPDEDQSA